MVQGVEIMLPKLEVQAVFTPQGTKGPLNNKKPVSSIPSFSGQGGGSAAWDNNGKHEKKVKRIRKRRDFWGVRIRI